MMVEFGSLALPGGGREVGFFVDVEQDGEGACVGFCQWGFDLRKGGQWLCRGWLVAGACGVVDEEVDEISRVQVDVPDGI